MRVLMLSWDFPPTATVGLTRQVAPLSTALAAAGHDVTVVTRHVPGAPLDEVVGQVRVVRTPDVPPAMPRVDQAPLAWTLAMNRALTRAGLHTEGFDLIHAHGWPVTHAAVTLKDRLGIPLVATIHATEAGRHQGYLRDETNRSVHSVEWWLGSESSRVVVPSEYMSWEVSRLFGVPSERIDVVPVGLDRHLWTASTPAVAAARLRFTGEGPLVVYAGRLLAEKRVEDLLAAAPALRIQHPGTRFVIAGDGPHRAALIDEARQRKLHRAVSFPGHLDRENLAALLSAADAVVLPMHYDPSGMIALEAAAAGAPLAVASTGALAEIVEPGVTGVRFPPGDVPALVEATSTLIGDPLLAQTLAARARERVEERHSWPVVATSTAAVYAAALSLPPEPIRPGGGHRVVLVPSGNLLAGAPTYGSTVSDTSDDADDDVFDLAELDAVADDPAWAAGVRAARAAVQAEVARAATQADMAREIAEREAAGRVAADALDIVLASTHRV